MNRIAYATLAAASLLAAFPAAAVETDISSAAARPRNQIRLIRALRFRQGRNFATAPAGFRAAARAARLQDLFGVEFGFAFGAASRAAIQVVEFRLAVGAHLLGAQFGIGHGG